MFVCALYGRMHLSVCACVLKCEWVRKSKLWFGSLIECRCPHKSTKVGEAIPCEGCSHTGKFNTQVVSLICDISSIVRLLGGVTEPFCFIYVPSVCVYYSQLILNFLHIPECLLGALKNISRLASSWILHRSKYSKNIRFGSVCSREKPTQSNESDGCVALWRGLGCREVQAVALLQQLSPWMISE